MPTRLSRGTWVAAIPRTSGRVKKYCWHAAPNASVAIVKYTPRSRSEGRPRMRLTAAPMSPPHGC